MIKANVRGNVTCERNQSKPLADFFYFLFPFPSLQLYSFAYPLPSPNVLSPPEIQVEEHWKLPRGLSGSGQSPAAKRRFSTIWLQMKAFNDTHFTTYI